MTALGIDNYGRMTYRYGYEEIDYVDGTSDWVWNAPNHVFFLRLRELFDAELCELYTKLESTGCWSATSLINQFNDWQMQFPEELWRTDIQRKYIRTYTTSFINGKAYPEFLMERANGRKKTQRSQFERNQEKYMSSKFSGTVASADDIILRCSVPNTTLAVEPNFDMHLTPYSYVYLNVKYNTSPPIKIRAVPNQEYTISYTDELADIIEIYSASCLKSVGDLSACYLTNGTFANATKIRELILGNATEGYNNTNVMTLGLGSNELLNKLDIQNMSGLTHSLELSGLKNLEELYAFGSGVSGIVFADGGNIETVEIPDVGSLQMKNLAYLDDEGFESTSYNNLSKLIAENSQLDLIELINNAPNLRQVRLTGIDWNLEDTTLLEHLYGLAGVTNTGANTDQSVLAGEVYVPTIKQQKLNEYNAVWPDLTIRYSTLIEQVAVTFINEDGTVLEVQYVDKGEYAVDPTTREENPIAIPTKESSISTDYTFSGWSNFPTGQVHTAYTVTATYSESPRSYTIRYMLSIEDGSGNEVVSQELWSSEGEYGTNVSYGGQPEIPTYTMQEAGYTYYLFNRWDKSGFILEGEDGADLANGEKIVKTKFDRFHYNGASDFAGREIADLSPVEIYALTKLTEPINTELSDIGMSVETGDDYSFTMGYDIDYDDIESNEIISEKRTFTGLEDDYLDTGITLFDEDRDFVLAIDYEISSDCVKSGTLMQCFQTSGSNGFKLGNNASGSPEFVWGASTMEPSDLDNREMLVIRHIAGDNNLYVYTSNLTSTSFSLNTLTKTTATQSDSATLIFGAHKKDSGSIVNYGIGDIHWCKIWYKDLGEDICEKLVGWTHEKITLEVSGFYRYALYDDYTKESMMSLLATHLLDCKKKYNNTNTVSGGWASSALNSFLNTRFYEAIPDQMKSLIKKVSVASHVGDKTNTTSSSGCYVTIPSAYDIDDTQTAYSNEVYDTNGTIDYMTSNAMRVRSYADGTAGDYWLRSPDIRYTSYPLYVDSDGDSQTAGSVYSFTVANSDMGVLIEVSF